MPPWYSSNPGTRAELSVRSSARAVAQACGIVDQPSHLETDSRTVPDQPPATSLRFQIDRFHLETIYSDIVPPPFILFPAPSIWGSELATEVRQKVPRY